MNLALSPFLARAVRSMRNRLRTRTQQARGLRVAALSTLGVIRAGRNCRLGRGTVIAAATSVEIGAYTLIAEHCSIRDANHQKEASRRRQEFSNLIEPVAKPLALGRDNWLGAGVRILMGAKLGDAVIVGANSVVVAGDYPSGSVLVGAPAKPAQRTPQPARLEQA